MVTTGATVPRRSSLTAPPMRTCIGCRGRDRRSTLLRVVVVVDPLAGSLAVPDPDRVRPGRGASLHYDQQCLAMAVKRRAFGRALRVPGSLDFTSIEAVLNHQL